MNIPICMKMMQCTKVCKNENIHRNDIFHKKDTKIRNAQNPFRISMYALLETIHESIKNLNVSKCIKMMTYKNAQTDMIKRHTTDTIQLCYNAKHSQKRQI